MAQIICTKDKIIELDQNSNFYTAPKLKFKGNIRDKMCGAICFGRLTSYSDYINYYNNTGIITVKLCKERYHLYNYPNTFLDNKLELTIPELKKFLNRIKSIVEFKYRICVCKDEDIYLKLNFIQSSRAEILFVLNMVRRTYRYTMALQLKYLMELEKKTQYDINLFELIYLADNVAGSSCMYDDMLVVYAYQLGFYYSPSLFREKGIFNDYRSMQATIEDKVKRISNFLEQPPRYLQNQSFIDPCKKFSLEEYNDAFYHYTMKNMDYYLNKLYQLDLIKLKNEN